MDLSFLFIILLLVLASIQDLQKKEVSNWLSYTFLFPLISKKIIESLVLKDASIIINAMLGFLIATLLAFILYKLNIWGGGDLKILVIIGTYLGINIEHFLYNDFLLYISIMIVVASLYSIVALIYFLIRDFNKIKEEYKRSAKENIVLKLFLLAFLLISLALNLITQNYLTYYLLIVFSLITATYLILKVYRIIEKVSLTKYKFASEIVEGDWIVGFKDKKNKTRIFEKIRIADKKLINELSKESKKVIVKEGIAFVPVFLLTLIVQQILNKEVYNVLHTIINLIKLILYLL